MDLRQIVQQVQEYFGDFVALEPHHFVVPLPRPHLAMQPFSWDFGNSSDAISRMTEGVASLMLSLRRRFLVRCVAALASFSMSYAMLWCWGLVCSRLASSCPLLQLHEARVRLPCCPSAATSAALRYASGLRSRCTT
jgi:hypothetical protein